MGQHKKSKSWSALISFPAMLTPSSSSGTRQSCQPTITSNSNNATENQDSPQTQQTKTVPAAISMKKSSSQQQYPAHSYSHNDSKNNNTDGNDDMNNNGDMNKHTELDNGLGTDLVLHSLPLFYLFSSVALADEHAKEDIIIPFMEPPSLALDQATLIAGVLESLVRVVEDIPTGFSDDDSSSCNMTNDTEHEENDTDSDGNSDVGDNNVNAFDIDRSGGNSHLDTTWASSSMDDENDLKFDSSSSSSSTRRSPYTLPPFPDQQQPTSTRHTYPRPSASPLSNFSSSTSAYTLRNTDHHHTHRYRSELPVCPFTIIGLGSFKVALWPSVLHSFSGNQDLNLVVLVSPTYPDHDIIDIMYKMEKSLKQVLSSVIATTIDAQLIGQHLTPLVRNSFTVE